MCRNIKTLRRAGSGPTEEELHLAALQYVRKVSGYRSPSRVNQPAFDAAVREISEATGKLLAGLSAARPSSGLDGLPSSKPHARPRARRYSPG